MKGQFFINLSDNLHVPNTVFGRLVVGQELALEIRLPHLTRRGALKGYQPTQRSPAKLKFALQTGHTLIDFDQQTQAMLPRTFVPILEAIRLSDLASVKLLAEVQEYDWARWKHKHPILTALSYGKPKIAAYFVELGVPVSHDFRQGLAATTIAASLVDLVNPTMLDQLPLVKAILEKAALEGDLGTLDKMLKDYPFYSVEFSTSELESQRYDSICNWRTAPGMSEIGMAAVNQPAALE